MVSIVLILAFIVLRLSRIHVAELHDEDGYLWMSRLSITDVGFWWSGFRPFFVPLLFKLCREKALLIVVVQSLLSIGCWVLVASAFAAGIHRSSVLANVALGSVLACGLSDSVVSWDGLAMSESCSISLMVAIIGQWYGLLRGWQSRKLAALAGTILLWAFTRDSNAWLILSLAGALVVIMAFCAAGARARLAVLVAIFLVVFAGSASSAGAGNRWLVPYYNVVFKRILPVPAYRDYFEARGMPVIPALLDRSGKFAWDDHKASRTEPGLEGFRQWVKDHGKATYFGFLVTHPTVLWLGPLHDSILEPDEHLGQAGVLPALSSRGLGVLTGIGLLALIVLVVMRPLDRRRAVIPALLFVLSCLHAVQVWNMDAAEVQRHAQPIVLLLELGAIFSLFTLLDCIQSAQ